MQFIKVMGSGRTKPWLVVARTDDGEEVEVIVKLRGSCQLFPNGLASEMVAALLARDLDIPVADPLFVSIDEAFVHAIPDSAARLVGEGSIGLNFGTKKWEPGFAIWSRGLPVSEDLRQTLGEIFAFDAIVQNPDRTSKNPNCVFHHERVIVFDHELAFSNLLAIASAPPWDAEGFSFLTDHVFRFAVVHQEFRPDRMRDALRFVSQSRVEDYLQFVPASWTPTSGIRTCIIEYLHECLLRLDTIVQRLEALR